MTPHILFLFVDGIGLGVDDPASNPFAVAEMPTLRALTNGKRWMSDTGVQVTPQGVFVPTDAQLGIPGRPQSGSSQAAILTGRNVPALIGEHYGPKPNEATRAILREGSIFTEIKQAGQTALLLDAYPQSLLASIQRGKTLPSSIQMVAIESGQALLSEEAYRAGKAVTAEWTGEEWHTHLKLTDMPIYTPQEAGRLLVTLSREVAFAFHSHWMTDYVGHRGKLEDGVRYLERLDGVIGGILEVWNPAEGLVLLTSDHGNMEHLEHRHHTENLVPTLILGEQAQSFAQDFHALTDFVPRIRQFLQV